MIKYNWQRALEIFHYLCKNDKIKSVFVKFRFILNSIIALAYGDKLIEIDYYIKEAAEIFLKSVQLVLIKMKRVKHDLEYKF